MVKSVDGSGSVGSTRRRHHDKTFWNSNSRTSRLAAKVSVLIAGLRPDLGAQLDPERRARIGRRALHRLLLDRGADVLRVRLVVLSGVTAGEQGGDHYHGPPAGPDASHAANLGRRSRHGHLSFV